MAAIIVLIFIIYAYSTSNSIKKLQQENERLKEELQKVNFVDKEELTQNVNSKERTQEERTNFKSLEKTNESSYSNYNERIQSTNTTCRVCKKRLPLNDNGVCEECDSKILSRMQSKKELAEKEKEKREREKKNTSILVTGAILIVLSAIVFLMSTWHVIPNILKTIVMILFVGVFLGASKIAKNKFKLEKTSITFFYIAMAYIPICLISCSIFGLFGEFLSIRGEGRYAYLTVAIIITSLIYYLYYTINNNKNLLFGTVLAQILAVVLFTLIFEESIIVIIMNLLIYNIILTSICKRSKIFEVLNIIYINIPYVIGVISVFYIFFSNVYMLIVLPLLSINFWLTKSSYNEKINSILTNISVYLFGLYTAIVLDIDISGNLKLIFSIIYWFCISVLNLIFVQDENMNKSSRIISLISGGLIFAQCTMYYESYFVKPYIISLIELMLLVVYFITSEEDEKSVYSYLIPLVFIVTEVNVLRLLKASYYWYIIFSIITFIFGELIRNKKLILLNKGFFIISHIFIIVSYFSTLFIATEEVLKNIIIYLLIGIVYIYSLAKNKKSRFFKYLIYLDLGLLLSSIVNFFELSNIIYLVPVIVAILVLIFENKYESLKDEYTEGFNIIIQIFSYITLLEFNHISKILILFLYSVFLIFDNLKNNKNEYLRCIPMIGLLIGLNTNILTTVEGYNILIILLSTISLTLISIYKGSLSVDTIFSGIYLINLLTYIENEFIRYIFLIIWSLANVYFMRTQKSKDLFKGIACISIFLLYESFIEILNLDIYSSFSMIGITILAIILIKSILKNYSRDTDKAEYITLLLIYLASLVSYSNEKDGMIYGMFLVILLICSYVNKYGAVFIITLIGIIVNAIVLTREFWLLIPWWIYLLVVGSILIAFAVKNESDENKNKIDARNIIKNLKDKIEK